MRQLRIILSAAVAALACWLAVVHTTPVDRALPLIAVVVTLVATASYPSLMLAVPLLVIAEMAIPAEGTRLLAFGVVVAAVFAIAICHPGRDARDTPSRSLAPLGMTLGAIVLLRWIPFADVQPGRESLLLAIALLLVLVLDRTPFAVALAVIVVLLTPAIPLRTLLLPIAVLFVAVMAKTFGMPKVRWTWPSSIAIAFVMLFFAWSGVVARASPYLLLHRAKPDLPRTMIHALPANESLTMTVPEHATSLLVSGANVARMPRNTILGRIEPGGQVVRIGDAADWGYTRREHFYGSRNPLPRDPAGKLRGYGYSAWVDGAGRVPLPRASVIRITADASLPSGASLQVEGFE